MRRHLKKSRVARAFTDKFDDELNFIRTWIRNPKTTGSIVPTGPKLAKSMASLVRPQSGLPVLELGPGTGPITKAILDRGIAPDKLYALEYSKQFLGLLSKSFPDVNFIHGDAFKLDEVLDDVHKFDTIISGLPLLNFPQQARIDLIESLLDRLPVGRPVVQFSYGPLSPVLANRGSYQVKHYNWVVRNVPPARVWLYTRQP